MSDWVSNLCPSWFQIFISRYYIDLNRSEYIQTRKTILKDGITDQVRPLQSVCFKLEGPDLSVCPHWDPGMFLPVPVTKTNTGYSNLILS